MLKFLGTGSAFNTELGNNSAYIKKEESLLLIDCGGTVFHRLQALQLLENLKQSYVVITHTHPDHVGSLGEVIFYCYYVLKFKPTIIFPNESLIRSFLRVVGVADEMYHLQSQEYVTIKDAHLGEINIQFRDNKHVETIPAYSFIMSSDEESFYYSGDANRLSGEIINLLKNKEIDALYQDTCGLDYEGNAHLFLGKLSQVIPVELRNKVYCMHFDKHIKIDEIKELGFKYVKLYEGE